MYPRAFWKDAGYSGQMVSDDVSEPVQWSVDHSNGDNTFCALIGFINGRRSVKWRDSSADQRRRAICEQYSRFFKIPELLQAVDYVECDWATETFSRGK